jgi:type I restriction-modification system DNA methylase subunit
VRDVFEDAYNYMKSGQLMRQVVNKINKVDFNNLAERQHFGDIYEQILNDLQSAGNGKQISNALCFEGEIREARNYPFGTGS